MARGFNVRCPNCGAEDSVHVSLGDTASLRCESCSEEFSIYEVKAILSAWERVVLWLETAPQRKGA